MPLQNRVTPTGEIIATPHRGLLIGNRGIIHDPATKTLREKALVVRRPGSICVLGIPRAAAQGDGRRRSWTELFFLDEATAFAAGHRPCFYCRRDDANRFRAAWEAGNGIKDVLAPDIDAVLHRERFCQRQEAASAADEDRKAARRHDGAGRRRQFSDRRGQGAEVVAGRLHAGATRSLENAMLLTPPSTVRAFAAGYRPVLHPSVG